MLICSLMLPQLSVFSFDGDLINNLHSISIYKNNCILFNNPIDNCLEINTLGGHLVHKKAIPSGEETGTCIDGLVSARMLLVVVYILPVNNSKN